MSDYDVALIGSGHNALVCAAYLAKAGRRVLVLERNDRPGGFVRNDEIIPGFLGDSYAASFPLLMASPVFAALGPDLEARGLHFANTEYPTGVSMEDGTTAVLPRSAEALIREAERLAPGDGAAVEALLAEAGSWAGEVFPLFSSDLTAPAARAAIDRLMTHEGAHTAFAGALFGTARQVLAPLRSQALRSVLGSWVSHVSKGPDEIGSGLWVQIFMLTLMGVGMPIPLGGSEQLARALTRLITDHGGAVESNAPVAAVLVEGGKAVGVRTQDGVAHTAREAVVAGVAPDQLYGTLLPQDVVPPHLAAAARRFRYGRGCVQINLALSEPPRWRDERFATIGQPFLTDSFSGHAMAVTEGLSGLLPSHPTFTADAPTAHDPSRAPPGKAIMRVQVLDIPCRPVGDAGGTIEVGDGTWSKDLTARFVDRVLAIVGRHIPNVPQAVLGMRVETPDTIAAFNPNTGPGDPYGGAQDLGQLYTLRPLPGQGSHRTFLPNLHMLGAATWPGAGVGGFSGHIVAKAILGEA